MKFQRWWLPIFPIFLVGILGAAFPWLQQSLYFVDEANSNSGSTKRPGAILEPTSVPARNDVELPPTAPRHQQVKAAIVTVYGADGLGSGMVLRSDGLILTNKHIVDNSATVSVKTADGQTFNGTVVDFDLRYDLALIKLKHPQITFPTIQLAETVKLKPGERVYAIGSPAGQAGTLTIGTFTQVTAHGSLQTSPGLLNPGNSGGALLNEAGVVVGVNKGLLEDKSGLATPVAAAKALLQRYETINP